MKFKLKIFKLSFFLGCLILLSSSNINSLQIDNKKNGLVQSILPDIIIPDDYSTIQLGINNANPGDTIFVRNGVYYENIIIEKKITLVGENKNNTIIDGILNLKSTIIVNSDNVIIKNFSIINGLGENIFWDNSGVFINSSNVTIENNIIMWNTLGICVLDTAYNLIVCNNDFINDSILVGNYVHTTDSFTLKSVLHIIENNTVNGKPLYYVKNKSNFIVPNDAGQIILVNCSNATINNNFFTKVDFPIILYFCNKCLIENVTSKDTYGEIILFYSNNCTIQYINASNMIFGVCLDYKSTNNAVRYNEVYNNIAGITVMASSKYNKIYKNYIHHNTEGIRISNKSSYNIFYENILVENKFGFSLFLKPHDNNIQNNTILKTSFCVKSIGKTKNYYNNNYWNKPRVIPKFIFGWLKNKNFPVFTFPCFITGVDWHPLKERPV